MNFERPAIRNIEVEQLKTAASFEEASDLYRRAFEYDSPALALNSRLMSSLIANGGSVLGARDEVGNLIAFTYGFWGNSNGEFYHYSQAAVVDARYQGRGYGRALKLAQREYAVRGGAGHMRWAYDPWIARNGYFNLDVLGAVGRWYDADFYQTGTDLGGEPSNRIIVDWALTSDPVRSVRQLPENMCSSAPDTWGAHFSMGDMAWISLPADPEHASREHEPESKRGRTRLGESLSELTREGYVLLSCQRRALTCVYVLQREGNQ